jgi:bifunctional NMN adenylyltransferase/nudix hydrolase
MNTKKLGVIIGRFQVPEIHAGHSSLIKYGLDNFDHVLILLGLPKTGKPSDDDPLSAELRARLLKLDIFAKNKVTIQTIKGRSNDKVWSENVDILIDNMEYDEATLLGAADSFIPYYTGRYKTIEIETFKTAISGTLIRENIGKSLPAVDNELKPFARGIIWSQENRYPVNVPVVDIMVFKNKNENEILLGRKANETTWRFPGGYVDINDKSFEYAAARELSEEVGIYPGVSNIDYVMSYRINDWRYAKSKDRMISTVFKCSVYSGINQAKAGDDLEEIRIFTIEEALDNIMLKDHQDILKTYIDKKTLKL